MFTLNKLLLAVAGTLMAGQVFAVPVTPDDIKSAKQNGSLHEAWISGASAPTYNVFQGFAAGCDPDTLSFFHDQTTTNAVRPGSAGDNLGYACKRGGTVSVLYHTIAGGSYNAFAPHVDGVKLTRLKNLNSLSNNGCVAGPTIRVNDNQTAVRVYRTCATGVGATLNDNAPTLPAGGFSDVEAQLFGKDVSAVGSQAPANVGQVFGVAVSAPLYRALQTAQKIAKNTDALDPGFDPENAPSISSAQYTALITGTYTDWNNIVPRATWDNIIGSNKTAQIRIGRRVDTSGTQASSNAFFLKNPCNGDPAILGALPPQSAASAASLEVPTYIVTEDSSTSSLKSKFKNSTSTQEDDYVIGIMSLENNWRTEVNTARNGYRFIKVDGIHPEMPQAGKTYAAQEAVNGVLVDVTTTKYDPNARFNAANGQYGFHMEMVSFVANSAAGTFGETVIGEIVGAFAGLACADVPRGLTLNPLAGSSCVAGEEVAKMTRSGNNCQANQMLF
ncbi:hypothetical protein ACFQ1T_11825 [Methylophilus glucosoxydans]|uniref:PBP domain-containing protein n=1 Tax=Methylophilus glucosoxydans TaxID=752553 RepID=A0ABW3GJD7_9PROT|nr:hypothetical protein [Methylophilus sp. 13]MBF5038673.1 hypothetical protein [Methylophilus sp. 13]